jgi:NADPH2:quinone reductase
MRAIEIFELSGPDSAVRAVERPDPAAEHLLAPGQEAVVIDVHAAGVSFPEVLQTRGLYQYKPDLPFVPGSELAGTVRSAPAGSGLEQGDRVAAFVMNGAFAEVATAPPGFAFKLADELDFRQGAGLLLNYHTAWFSLVTRGRVTAGERVLVHGGAGGVGTATLQVCAPTLPGASRQRSSAGSTW